MVYGELLAVLSALCWAASGAVYKKGLEYTDAWMGNFMRTSATALGFLIFMAVKGVSVSSVTPELLFWLIFSAVFAFFIGDLFYMLALERSGVARAVPISSTYPLFVALWATIVYDTLPSPSIIVGSLLIVLAIYLISRQQDGKGRKSGILFAVFAAISWSASISVLDYLTAHLPAEAVAGFRFIIVSVLLSPVVFRGTKFSWKAFKWLGIGGMTIFALGNYTFVEAIRLAGSAKIAPISAIYPIIAAIFARMFLKEKLTVEIVAGTILSLIGVLLVISA